MVQKIIGVTDLQRRFKSVIDEVSEAGVPYIVTRGSRPEAALIPYEEYQRFQELEEKEVVFAFDRLRERMRERSKDLPEEDVLEDVRRARDEARSEARNS